MKISFKFYNKKVTLSPYILYFNFLIQVGVVHQVLARTGCNQSEGSPEAQGCPLPPEFNHNSVLHLMLMVTMTIYFVAELQAIKRRNDFLEKADKTVKIETIT